MNNSPQRDLSSDDAIVDYIDGNLNSEEVQLFEGLMEKDAEFHKKVEIMRATTQLFKYPHLEKSIDLIKNAQKSVQEKKAQETTSKRIQREFIIRIAAALIGVVFFVCIWILITDKNSYSEIITIVGEAFLEPPSSSIHTTMFDNLNGLILSEKEAEEAKNIQDYVLSEYKQANYKNVKEKIEDTYQSNKVLYLNEYTLYEALSTYHLNDKEAALKDFESIVVNDSLKIEVKTETYWYLALAYLEKKKTEEAQRQLNYLKMKGNLDYLKDNRANREEQINKLLKLINKSYQKKESEL